jgi:hypothetical protein
MARTAIDRDAYLERYALLYEAAEADGCVDNHTLTRIAQQANAEASELPFSRAATALANGNQEPAKELCRREMAIHGRAWAVELWHALQEAAAEA